MIKALATPTTTTYEESHNSESLNGSEIRILKKSRNTTCLPHSAELEFCASWRWCNCRGGTGNHASSLRCTTNGRCTREPGPPANGPRGTSNYPRPRQARDVASIAGTGALSVLEYLSCSIDDAMLQRLVDKLLQMRSATAQVT